MSRETEPTMVERDGALGRKRSVGTRVLEYTCAFLVAILAVLLFVQVVGRYALHNPPEWTEELGRTVFAYCTFVGAALGIARNAHLRVDTLAKLLPASVQPWIRLLVSICAIVFLGVVLYYSQIMLPRLAFQQLSSVPLSKAWFFAAVPIGCSLMLIYELHLLWTEMRRLAGARGRSSSTC